MFVYMVVAQDTDLKTCAEAFKFFQVISKNPIRARLSHPLGKSWRLRKQDDGKFIWARRDKNDGKLYKMSSGAQTSWIKPENYKRLRVFKVCNTDSRHKILKRAGVIKKIDSDKLQIEEYYSKKDYPDLPSGTIVAVGILKL